MISKKQLEKFKQLYRDKFGMELTNQDALEKATKLVRLMEIIYKPMSLKDFNKMQKRRLELGEPPMPRPKLAKRQRYRT